jgi:hypothetical protein
MNYIKKYESFDVKSLDDSKVELTKYYYCDDCEGAWEDIDSQEKCKFCHFDSIEDLSAEEWHNIVDSNKKD